MIEQVELIVRERMSHQGAGHGMDHVMRVLRSARKIQAETGGDLEVVELAALLHDIGDAKFHDGIERSGELAREILGELGASEALISHVANIVDNISYRKGVDANELSIEGKIVQDADRIDALGAIGIVRTIQYGEAIEQPFYSSDPSDKKTGVSHFHEKLFKLTDLLNTDIARRMAKMRVSYMRSFLDQFLHEMED